MGIAVLGIVCHHFSRLILAEPPCLAELERIQVQEAAKKKPGKFIIDQSSTVKFRIDLIEDLENTALTTETQEITTDSLQILSKPHHTIQLAMKCTIELPPHFSYVTGPGAAGGNLEEAH